MSEAKNERGTDIDISGKAINIRIQQQARNSNGACLS